MRDFEDIFSPSPKSKFYDILFHANQSVVEVEVEVLLDRFLALESIVASMSEEDPLVLADRMIASDYGKISEAKNDLYISFVQDVLSKHE